MTRTARLSSAGLLVALGFVVALGAQGQPPAGFVSIFNGKDLTGWKIPENDGGHWKVVDGVIDYDAGSMAQDKNLWTVKSYRNFELMVDWRIKEVVYINRNMKIVMPDGTNKKNADGKEINMAAPDSDSGIVPRGFTKSQFNIWNWPVGSGEMYGYRTDAKSTPEMRRNATPRMNADKNIGEWNTFHITVVGSSVTCMLNGQTVIPRWTLPDLPASGPIGLQHHGGPKGPDGTYSGIPALLQFRNIYVKELP
jgi:hypothetical protein